MLNDLLKYTSDNCDLSEEEQFIRYIIQHCRNQRIKNILIDGIRSNATDLIYDHDRIFHFFNGDQHQYDLFYESEFDVSILLLAYLYCIFNDDEFYIQGTSIQASDFYNYYINYPESLKRSDQMVGEISDILVENSCDNEILEDAMIHDDEEKIAKLLSDSGWDEWYIDTTELYFHEIVENEIYSLLQKLIECLGLQDDGEGMFYIWCVTPDGQINQDGEPEKDLLGLIETAEQIRKYYGRNNFESEIPYKDVIRVFEETGRNNELILAISSIHESEREVLF